jgi:hypothetical protein
MKGGLSPGKARRRMNTKHPSGVCSASGEQNAIGVLYRGKFFCSEFLEEKLKETGSEQ